jgi:hypothetical protein
MMHFVLAMGLGMGGQPLSDTLCFSVQHQHVCVAMVEALCGDGGARQILIIVRDVRLKWHQQPAIAFVRV